MAMQGKGEGLTELRAKVLLLLVDIAFIFLQKVANDAVLAPLCLALELPSPLFQDGTPGRW